jgi:poly(A) polymerase
MPDHTEARAVATRIVQRLREADHTAYFAGGCVRDELLGLHPKDYDVATDATPDQVRRFFKRTNEVGASFGVMLVRLDRVTIEVATFREEAEYTDRRRPDHVRYADPIRDAHRRDFTINALFLDPLGEPGVRDERAGSRTPPEALGLPEVDGEVLDFVGGVEDLRRRVVRAVGDPEARLAEDHLRALRAVRFAARLGFDLDEGTAEAIHRHTRDLLGVSRERVGEELRRMLEHPTRREAVRLMARLGLTRPTLQAQPRADRPEPEAGPAMAALPEWASFPAALAAWTLDRRVGGAQPRESLSEEIIEADVAGLRDALCLTNDERRLLRGILRAVRRLETDWGVLGVAERKRLAASEGFSDALAITRGRRPALGERVAGEVEALHAIGGGLAPDPLLTGDDLTAMGVSPGPRIGDVLRQVYDAQLEDRVREKGEAADLAKRLLRESQTE